MIRRGNKRVVMAFAAIYVIWGSTYLAIKLAIATIPPLTMTATRSVVAGAVLYAWGRWRGAGPARAVHWAGGAVVGAFLFLGGHGALAWAEQHVQSGVASLFTATLPLWMTITGVVTERNEKVTVRRLSGITAGMIGILLLVGPRDLLGGEPVHPMGAAALVFSALVWSVGSAVARSIPQGSSTTVTTGIYLLTGGALLYVAGILGGELGRISLTAVSVQSLAALAHLIVFGSVVAFGAYSWLLQRTSLAAVSTYAFVNPIIAVALGWVVAGEPATQRVLAAGVFVIAGVLLILTGRSPQLAEAAVTARRAGRVVDGAVPVPSPSEECA